MRVFATVAGFAVTAGSLLLFTPMIARVWQKKSAEGLSVSTWALNLAGFAAGAIYPCSRGFPIAQYGRDLVHPRNTRKKKNELSRLSSAPPPRLLRHITAC